MAGSQRNSRLRVKSAAKSVFTNHRNYRRVSVCLPGALCLPDNQVSLTHTLDISEGGVSVSNDEQLKLSPGDKIKLHLEGVVSSGPQHNLDIYNMQVIYQTGSKLGLCFTRS